MDRSISYNLDGSVTLVNGDQVLNIENGAKNKDARIAAFFPDEVPPSVTPLQMRKALRHVGLKPSVDAYIASLGDSEAVEEWEYALAIERGNPVLDNAATLLGMTSDQVDDLFRLAATLT